MNPFKTIDARELPPPEPLERTLEALEELPRGEHLVLLLYCRPQPLYTYLQRNGYRWDEQIQDDGTHAIRIEHRDAR